MKRTPTPIPLSAQASVLMMTGIALTAGDALLQGRDAEQMFSGGLLCQFGVGLAAVGFVLMVVALATESVRSSLRTRQSRQG